MTFRHPVDRWEPWHVEVNMISGPDRIYDRDHEEDTERKPVGFASLRDHWISVDDSEMDIEPHVCTPDWKPDPHPWCGKHCCPPDTCDCPTPVTIPPNIAEGMGSE